jgi:NADPH-dependent curcumin reductase CurA
MAELLTPDQLDLMTHQVATLADIPILSQEILKGKIRGRVVVDLSAS